LGANVPQAWAAGSVFALLQAILGFVPDAPRGKLHVDPLLPAWLPDLTVLDLRVGGHCFDIRFWREGAKTQFELLRGDQDAIERSSFGATFGQLKVSYHGRPHGPDLPQYPNRRAAFVKPGRAGLAEFLSCRSVDWLRPLYRSPSYGPWMGPCTHRICAERE